MTTNFYLDRPNIKNLCRVYLYIRGLDTTDNKKPIKIKTSISIAKSYWNPKEQCIRKNFTDCVKYNKILEDFKVRILSGYNQILNIKSDIDFSELEKVLKAISNGSTVETEFNLQPKKPLISDIWVLFENFLKVKRNDSTDRTIKRYKVLINHLKKFETAKNYKLGLNTFDFNFKDSFYGYLITEINLTNNTVQKLFKQLKTFLRWCQEREFEVKIIPDVFKIKGFETDVIPLTISEFEQLISLDLSKNQSLDKVKDLFIFQTLTGQRFSDIQNFKFTDIISGEWYLRTEKTNSILRIPLAKQALEIIEKYKELERLPKISNQKMNDYIKEVCKLADIDTLTTITRYSGNKTIQIEKPKYEFVSSHTARKSFATIALEKGVPAQVVMSITGHKDYKVFRKYVAISEKSKKDAIKQIWD